MHSGQTNWPFVINVSNSIIGVTVLAMPFCFKTCGIILGSLMLLFSTWLTMKSCELLMKAGITSRRRSYSLLAYYTHGATGKLIVELGMIGLQLGTLVAQVVVIGDLGPAIVSKFTGLPNTDGLRTGLIVIICLFVGLPLCLLKDVRTLSKTSAMCILFYAGFTVYVVLLSVPKLVTGSWYSKVVFWRQEGFFQCLPIFSFAFGCQTQLFIVYEALSEPSLKRINSIVSAAVHLCTAAYLLVGFFGYIAYCDVPDLSGDIINHFGENTISDAIKICFVFSIAVTLPLIVFPCRASLYTLLFPQKPKEDVPGAYKIPELHFKVITTFIVIGSMIIGILVPNVEFVLGLNGATMGTLICYIFPALFFLAVMSDSSEGKFTGKLVLVFGLTILIVSTYTTLNMPSPAEVAVQAIALEKDLDNLPIKDDPKVDVAEKEVPNEDSDKDTLKKPPDKETGKAEVRQEPPVPVPPDDKEEKPQEPDADEASKDKVVEDKKESDKDADAKDKDNIEKRDTDTDLEKERALKEEEKKDTYEEKEKILLNDEIKEKILKEEEERIRAEVEEKARREVEEKLAQQDRKQEEILEKLEQQKDEQQKILEEQKHILEELKQHQDTHKEEEGVKAQEQQGVHQPVANAQAGDSQVVVQQQAQQLQNQPVQQVAQAQQVAQQQGVQQQLQQGVQQQGVLQQQGIQQQGVPQQQNVQQQGVQQQQNIQQQGVQGIPLQQNVQQQGAQQQVVQQAIPQQQGVQQQVVQQQQGGQVKQQQQGGQVVQQQQGGQQLQGVNNGAGGYVQGQVGQQQVGLNQQVVDQPVGVVQPQAPQAAVVNEPLYNFKPIVGNDGAAVKQQNDDTNLRMKRDIEVEKGNDGVIVADGKGRDLKQVDANNFVNKFLELSDGKNIEKDMNELNNKINKDLDTRNGGLEVAKDVEKKR